MGLETFYVFSYEISRDKNNYQQIFVVMKKSLVK